MARWYDDQSPRIQSGLAAFFSWGPSALILICIVVDKFWPGKGLEFGLLLFLMGWPMLVFYAILAHNDQFKGNPEADRRLQEDYDRRRKESGGSNPQGS
jgi:hypothetical protein